MRRNSGLTAAEISKHMVFYGNPGTGKTTIARKLAEIYRVLGVLSKGHFIETDRSSLVAGYLGQTAIKTTEVLERAKGGILFIDEAYTLCQGGEQDQYGQEAIDTILKYMEDNRDDLIVIVAGYESKMQGFIDSNPGLKSRFSKYFHFIDYDATQLAGIFAELATQSQYLITPSFSLFLENLCELMITRKGENFGNGRTVRNLFERCVSNQANRVIGIDNPSHQDLIELLDGDLTIQDLDVVMR
jgi:stage V sporulation protein K